MVLNNVVQNDLTAWGRVIWVWLGSRNACCDWFPAALTFIYLVNLCTFEICDGIGKFGYICGLTYIIIISLRFDDKIKIY
jgi:hypothetical protein